MSFSTFEPINDKVTILGGVNIDLAAFPNEKLTLEDDNPGTVHHSLGGVGRNIAENLARLGIRSDLISVLGDDIYAQDVHDQSKKLGINLSNSLVLEKQVSSIQVAIMNESHDLAVAISAMDIYDKIDVDFIKTKMHVFAKSPLTIIETNIPESVIAYVLENTPNHKFCLDPVSIAKAQRVKNLIHHFYMVKLNLIETETLTAMKLSSEEDYELAANHLHQKGVKKVFITLGPGGVFFSDGNRMGIEPPIPVKVENTIGAGDAFMAGAVYSDLMNQPINIAAKYGMGCAAMAVSHQNTVNPNLNLESVMSLQSI